MNIEIRELDTTNARLLSDSLAMLNRTQGEGLFKESYLTDMNNNPHGLTLCGFLDDKLVSVGCSEIIDDFKYYTSFDSDIVERFQNKKIGSLSTLCVREDLQGKGIGQLLTKKRMQWLQSQKCDLVIGISWVSGLAHTSKRVFEKLDFKAVKEVPDFFKAGALKHPFDCPGCKSHPCACSAILYEYSFKNSSLHS